jgi:hypothetical protein
VIISPNSKFNSLSIMVFPIKIAKSAGLFLISFGLTIKLLQLLNMGCSSNTCSTDGYHYGIRLFFGFIFLAMMGGLFISTQSTKDKAKEFRLFSAIATGLTILMAYIYARSLFNQVITDAPISRAEIFGILMILLALLMWKIRQGPASSVVIKIDGHHLIVGVAILLALCISVADRELPRLMLFSSDPDQHSFFARQIQHFGAVPYQQREWGPLAFNYPAGSGVVLYSMQLLGGLDPRSSLVALPILFTFFAALMIVEVSTSHIRTIHLRLLLLVSTLALVAGGLMFPLYAEYTHGEGSGRLLSIVFVGLLITALAPELNKKEGLSGRFLILPSLTLFSLMVLNPANALMPAVILASMVIYGWLNRKQGSTLFLMVMVGGVLLALLDPYYQQLAGISERAGAETLVLNERFSLLGPYAIATNTLQVYLTENDKFFRSISVLLVEQKPALFALLVMIYGACLLTVSRTPKLTKSAVFSSLALMVILYLVYGFTFAFVTDQRFYLLGPYFFFSISQYKAMFLVFLMILVIKKSIDVLMPFWLTIALSMLLVWPAITLIRNSQDMYLAPRRDFCGSMGCFPNDDKILLKDFQTMTRSGAFNTATGIVPKVLIPNSLSTTDIEAWIFPVSSARVLPHYDVLPAAFYYYQGEPGYGTTSYKQHVCQSFDRQWLLSRGIQYLYLPTERSDACIAGMEGLIRTETVVLKQGNAYLLQLGP